MRCTKSILCCVVLVAGCAAGEPPHYTDNLDGVVPRPDQRQDLTPQVDTYPPLADGGPVVDAAPQPDASCTLGTVANCAKCGDVCPGKDAKFTTRLCQQGACTIQCEGEYYDVNGLLKDGCEVSDDAPVHANVYASKNMGKVKDCDTTKITSAVMPSDSRDHTSAPTSRPNGREDWFRMHITDTAFCQTEARVDIKLSGLPAAAQFKAEVYFKCDNGKQLKTQSKSGYGANTLTLIPSTECTLGSLGIDSGWVYIRVLKVAGPHSSGKYSLEIMP